VRRQMAIDLDIYKKKIWIVPRALVGTFDFWIAEFLLWWVSRYFGSLGAPNVGEGAGYLPEFIPNPRLFPYTLS
jgi:hypothetical protein